MVKSHLEYFLSWNCLTAQWCGDFFLSNIKTIITIKKNISWQAWVSKLNWRLTFSYCLLVVAQCLKISLRGVKNSTTLSGRKHHGALIFITKKYLLFWAFHSQIRINCKKCNIAAMLNYSHFPPFVSDLLLNSKQED